jgi:hypothetical protein
VRAELSAGGLVHVGDIVDPAVDSGAPAMHHPPYQVPEMRLPDINADSERQWRFSLGPRTPVAGTLTTRPSSGP